MISYFVGKLVSSAICIMFVSAELINQKIYHSPYGLNFNHQCYLWRMAKFSLFTKTFIVIGVYPSEWRKTIKPSLSATKRSIPTYYIERNMFPLEVVVRDWVINFFSWQHNRFSCRRMTFLDVTSGSSGWLRSREREPISSVHFITLNHFKTLSHLKMIQTLATRIRFRTIMNIGFVILTLRSCEQEAICESLTENLHSNRYVFPCLNL